MSMTWEDAVVWLRNQPDKQEFVKDCYYDEPIYESTLRFTASSEWYGIKDLLGNVSGKKVLEIGAGRGLVSWAFAKEGALVTALEPDTSHIVGTNAMRRLQKDSGVHFDIVETFGETLPFETNTFDIVFCRCVLHHAHDLDKMCSEINRVLKTGGIFLADREHVITDESQLPAFFEQHPLHHLYGGENAFKLEQYLHALKNAAGFRKVRSIGSYDHIINLLPYQDQKQVKKMGYDALRKAFVPAFIARPLSKTTFYYKLYSRSLSLRDNRPGRFYSFLAIK
jgi:ubiquinone/menaquinone biosynthesis C-methylase UbiE